MVTREQVERWREQAIHDGAMSVPMADRIESMADMLVEAAQLIEWRWGCDSQMDAWLAKWRGEVGDG